ncbi:MAG TPA: MMPL family transporter, partial [Chloroflexota bacterium]|nr:MMPL family transporter [Chloroflexota bacterium]
MLFALGRALYRWRVIVVVLWAIVFVTALPFVPRVFRSLTAGGFTSPDLEAARAGQLLIDRFGASPSSLVLVFSDANGQLRATDPAFRGQVETALQAVRLQPDVERVVTGTDNARQISPDGQVEYVTLSLRGVAGRDDLNRIEQALQRTNLTLTLTGAPVFYEDIFEVTERDLRRAELLSIPLAAAALVFVFGSLVAGVLPGLIGGTAVAVTLAVMALLSQVFELSIFSLNLATMLGLGLGIDYSLFLVSRFREELYGGAATDPAVNTNIPGNGPAVEHRGASVEHAVAWSVAMAGRAVLYSGATVMIGLLALLTFDISALRSMGIAGVLVVFVSLLAALTLLPALLGLLGRRVDALTIGPLGRTNRALGYTSHNGFWSRLAYLVMAKPLVFLIPLLIVLIGLGLPFLRVELGAPDASILPTDVQSRKGFDTLRAHWGDGELSPLVLVFQTQDGSSPLTASNLPKLVDFMRRVQAHPSVARVASPVTLDDRLTPAQYQLLYIDPNHIQDLYARMAAEAAVRQDVLVAQVTSRYGQTDDRSKDLLRAIRATSPPEGFTLLVGGGTAGVVDYAERLYQQFPRAAAIVVVAIYIVLLRTFGSVLIPLKAVLMNVLSIMASYGALVVIFQEGALSDVLHFQPLGFVEASLPILMFCVLFGLSMDYEVFLLARVQEAHLQGDDNPTAIARGLERSGRIITSAAGIVVLVSLSFVAADIVLIKALGLGTAIAVLLDATLVRALLVPATLRLLGDWNWW